MWPDNRSEGVAGRQKPKIFFGLLFVMAERFHVFPRRRGECVDGVLPEDYFCCSFQLPFPLPVHCCLACLSARPSPYSLATKAETLPPCLPLTACRMSTCPDLWSSCWNITLIVICSLVPKVIPSITSLSSVDVASFSRQVFSCLFSASHLLINPGKASSYSSLFPCSFAPLLSVASCIIPG